MPSAAKLSEVSSRDLSRVKAVNAWFASHARDLPWRGTDCSAWGVLVSEVMLQQTPVARVEPVWREWMARWPTPTALAQATQADAVRAWGRLGYPRRAKRLWECARVLVERYGGDVPSAREDLLSLPGVGDYTASAVQVFAFQQPAVVLDTNVRRVLARAWGGEPMPPLSLTKAERDLAVRVLPPVAQDACTWGASSMELGALVCTARNPRCDACPLEDMCLWNVRGKPGLEEAPRRTQLWHGTDRQVRGRIMALLRHSDGPVLVDGRAEMADVEPGQLERCMASLVADALVAEVPGRPGWMVLEGQ